MGGDKLSFRNTDLGKWTRDQVTTSSYLEAELGPRQEEGTSNMALVSEEKVSS